jgi:hypothetical protein
MGQSIMGACKERMLEKRDAVSPIADLPETQYGEA